MCLTPMITTPSQPVMNPLHLHHFEQRNHLQLQPLEARAKPPAKPRRVRVLQVHLSGGPNDVEAEGATSLSHGYTSHWNNRDGMPFADHSCSRRYRSPFSDNFRRELVEEIRISKIGWGALVGLGIAQLHSFCPVEDLVWHRCCPCSRAHFSCYRGCPIDGKI